MWPILIDWNGHKVHTYGFCLALAFLAASWTAERMAKRRGWAPEGMSDLGFWIFLAAIAGSRLFHVLQNLSYYALSPIEAFQFWDGGLVFYGGFIAALPLFWVMSKRLGHAPLDLADSCAPSLAIAQFFGRLGCFAAGCCHGIPCDLPWAVVFRENSLVEPRYHGVPLHPVQVYESLSMMLVFIILLKIHGHRPRQGETTGAYFLLYGVIRFLLEIVRGDEIRKFLWQGGPSTSQAISVIMVLVGTALLLRARSTLHTNNIGSKPT